MFENLNELEKEKFNYLIKVLYEVVFKGRSTLEPYPNAIDTIKEELTNNSFCNVMEAIEKDGYTMLIRNSIRVLTDKGTEYAKYKLGLS